MLNNTDHFHGSDLEKMEDIYGIRKKDIKPHASNVNPLGISPVFKDILSENLDSITEYPDRNYTSLRQSLSNYTGASFNNILVGGGSTELIRLFIELISPKKTMIIEPTYSEYARDVIINDGECINYLLKEDDNFLLDVDDFISHLDNSIDLLIMCNPNNPTSTTIKQHDLKLIFNHCRANKIFVMIDETYIEFVRDIENVTSIPLVDSFDNIVVIRGVSKFFAAPGLRLGYAVCSNEKMLNEINNNKSPWTINSYASIAGPMFNDKNYISLTNSLIHTEQNLIYSALCSRKTIKVFKPEANFILIKLLKEDLTSSQVFDYCMNKGIMIRDCSNFNGLSDKYIRFCFLKPEDNDMAVNTILEIV